MVEVERIAVDEVCPRTHAAFFPFRLFVEPPRRRGRGRSRANRACPVRGVAALSSLMKAKKRTIAEPGARGYDAVLADVVRLIETARGAAARSVNAVMTATYWAIGRRIVEHEQGGAPRATYGEELLKSLASDLTAKLGRGFSERNLEQMRRFFLTWSISQTASAKSLPTLDGALSATSPAARPLAELPVFPLPWPHYVRLLVEEVSRTRRQIEARGRTSDAALCRSK